MVFGLDLLIVISSLIGFTVADPWGNPFYQPDGVHVTFLEVTMKVPAVPTNFNGTTMFIWPGIQPGNGENDGDPQGVDNGVLQPVLTFGFSCAPGTQPSNQWWISAQYVNTFTENPNFAGCRGGPVMPLKAGELVTCKMSVAKGTSRWTQHCSRSSDGRTVSFTFDLAGQKQNWAELVVELPTEDAVQEWNFPVYFYDFTFTTSKPMPRENCIVPKSGDNFISKGSSISRNKKTCQLAALGFWNTQNGSPPIKRIPPKNH